eukprot:7167010-Alexandrium_andersonii.AAC.1
MSASLVGSEMCIRDSTASIPPDTHTHTQKYLRGNRRVGWHSQAAHPFACLLYTSDAADDM